jgi:cyclophilin family peptidyl-prolyl cis-trans isomerase
MKTRSPRKQRNRWFYRPRIEELEPRDVPATAPIVDQLTNVSPFIPGGKSILLPITGTSPNGDPLTYSVTSSNSAVTATIENPSNQFLKISVANFGDMVFEMFGDLTPETVGRFAGLIQSGFYNGLTFHRVASGFVIQGGDPLGNGTGGTGPAFSFDDEFNTNAIYSGAGQLGLANSGRDTNGSQFFVTVAPERHLDFVNGIFGQLVRGFDVLQAINSVPTTPAGDGMPNTPVVITNMSLIQDNHDMVLLLKTTANSGSSVITVTAQDSATGAVSAPMTFSATIVSDSTNDPAFLNPIPTNLSTPENTALTFSVSGTDLENDTLTFNATSTSSNVTVSVVGGQITVTPVNGFIGSVPVVVSVTEAGQSSPDTQTVIVGVGPRKLTAVSGTPISSGTEGQQLSSVALGTFTDTAAGASVSDYTVDIVWGDGHDSSGSLQKGANGVFTVLGTNTYAQAGVYTFHVTVTLNQNLGGTVAKFESKAFINEATLTSQGIALSGLTGQSFNNIEVATVQDANPNSILANFSAMIDWGDGSTPTPGVIQLINGVIQVLGSHTYTSPGSFTVTATIRDSNSAGAVEDAVTTATASAMITAPTVTQLQQGYVAGLYRTELKREATTSEIDFWNAVLNMGVTRFQVAFDIEISPEHRILQIDDMFTKFLGRSPTLQEQLASLTSLQSGGTLEGIEANILASNEYFQNRASGDLTTLLQVLAIDVTGSPLPTAESNYYTWVFSSAGSFKREDAVLSFLHSQLALVAGIKQDYQDTLGRDADVGGAAQALELRKGGISDDVIRALLLSSDEGLSHLNAAAFTETVTG